MHANHPALPSFPTRRSSDLIVITSIVSSTPPTSVQASPFATPISDSLCPSSGLDRKSTRLNSSHEWISYAVFCLKKKNRPFPCKFHQIFQRRVTRRHHRIRL